MSWRLAYKNLYRNKRRTLSTGVAICVGFVAINLLGSYIYRSLTVLSLTSIYVNHLGHFIIYKKDGVSGFQVKPKQYLLHKSHIEEIQEKVLSPLKDNIEYTNSTLSGAALLSNGVKSHPIMIYGFEPEAYVRSVHQPLLLKEARDWLVPWQRENADMFLKVPDLIAVTSVIAEIMAFKTPLESNESVQVAARTFEGDLNAVNASLGAQHSTGSRFLEETVVLMPLQKLQELLSTDGIEALSVFLNPGVSEKAFEKSLREKALALSFPVDIYRYTDEEVNSFFQGTMNFLYVMVFFFVVLICSAVALTIVNALTMGIIERTREIGTLRAMGFTPKNVRSIFSRESLLISLFAMVIGTGLSFLIVELVNSAGFQFQPPGVSNKIDFRLEWNLVISFWSALLLTLVTWGSAQVVIRRKSRTKLILLLHDIGESS